MIHMEDLRLPENDVMMDNTTSINFTTDANEQEVQIKTVIKIEVICVPIICLFGLVGNTLSTITFLRRPLRKSPCSLYLATRGLSDNGFLLSILLIWTSSTFDLRLSQVKGVCQFLIFLTYLCGSISVWLCVFVSFENFLLIFTPFFAKRICTETTSKICICALTLISVSFYQMSLWIMNSDCSHDAKYSALTQVLVYTDTLFTLVVPTILISVLLFVITYRLVNIVRRKKPLQIFHRKSSGSVIMSLKPPLPISKITKMLFIVSLTFFVLNVPSHVIRLRLLIGTFIKGDVKPPTTEVFIQTIFQLIYYVSFSVNICVYLLFGSNFRKTFKATFYIKKTSLPIPHSPNEAVNLVRRNSYHGSVPDCDRDLLMVESPRRCQSDCF